VAPVRKMGSMDMKIRASGWGILCDHILHRQVFLNIILSDSQLIGLVWRAFLHY